MATPEDDLTVSREGRIGHICLNRPQALNALTLAMIHRIDAALESWRHDDSVEAILVTGAGDRAFCSGGDVKAICAAGQDGRIIPGDRSVDFFRTEYTLNHKIATYPKPYISYLDGVTMGGGVGISITGSHRIASERMTFAMPETAIGFYPDVGGSYFLSRLGPIGTMLALTGQPLDYRASLALGIATHFVPHDSGRELISGIADVGVDAALAMFVQPAPECPALAAQQALAKQCFGADTVEAILTLLDEEAASAGDLSSLAQEARDVLGRRSPTSLKVTREQLSRGRNMSLAACLSMEYRMSHAFLSGHDFYEGVRAVLIDKDHTPRWSPSSLDEVDDALVASYFDDFEDLELPLATA